MLANITQIPVQMSLFQRFYFILLNSLLYIFYLKHIITFRRRTGYFPNIALPTTYHEKMLWRKIFDHNPLFVVFSDKLATKDYAQKLIPGIKVPKTLWSGKDIRQAPPELFQQEAMIKANHGSSFNYSFKKNSLSFGQLEKLSRKWLRKKHGKVHLEWAYFKVDRTLFIEELIPAGTHQLTDLSMSCTDGKVIFTRVITNNKTPQRRSMFFDNDGCRLYDLNYYPDKDFPIITDLCPDEIFKDALKKAEILSKGVDFVRVDFMTNGTELYAGELTVYPNAGLQRVSRPGERGQDILINPLWDLKKTWFLSTPQPGWKGHYAKKLLELLPVS